MRLPYILLSCLTCLIFIVSCSDQNKEDEEKLKEDVMAVHNDIMPKMSDLNDLKRNLKVYKDQIPDENFAKKDSIINSILILSKANDNMMNWMAQWKYPDPDLSHEQEMKYLTAQKDSVKSVSDDVYMSIAVAGALLKNAPDSLKVKE